MPLPKYNEMFKHALEYLADNSPSPWRELEQPLAEKYELSSEECSMMYESGNGPIFLDRVSWCLSFLAMAKLVDRPKRGHYAINDLGKSFLTKSYDELQEFVRVELIKRDQEKAKQATVIEKDEDTETTPHEKLDQAFKEIRDAEYDQILDTILSKTPTAFEKLVILLLDKMGYGGQVKDAGTVTQASNDGGIDGIIKEDVLGLGRIHIQAKRYARTNSVGRVEIQNFVGALAVAQSNKGVFITTSSYSKGAIEYANSLNGATNLVLIDGEQLAAYIYEYGLGMQEEQTITIKKMDSDFWDIMEDEIN